MTNLGALDLDAMDYDPEEDDTEPSPHGRFLRGAARPGSASVRAWHGVIPAQHLTPLKADAMLLKEKAPGETFWIDAESTPRCSLEQLALAVLRFHAGSRSLCPDHVALLRRHRYQRLCSQSLHG